MTFDPVWAVEPAMVDLIVEIVRARRPRLVLELGSGLSTVILATELQAYGGKLVTLENDERHLRTTAEALEGAGCRASCDLRLSPLRPWYSLPDLPARSVDLLFVDGPCNATGDARAPALPRLEPFLAAGAVVIVDDANRPGERAMLAAWATSHPSWVARHVATERGAAVLVRK